MMWLVKLWRMLADLSTRIVVDNANKEQIRPMDEPQRVDLQTDDFIILKISNLHKNQCNNHLWQKVEYRKVLTFLQLGTFKNRNM
jgi:tRNA A37 N6-isopentenylltransferase MiaA